MIENVLIAGLATVYFAFVFTAKRGPFDFFAKIRTAAKRMAVAGIVLALHGMAGYWHSKDDE